MLDQPYGRISLLIRAHAERRPKHLAFIQGDRRVTYAQLDAAMDRIAAGLAREGVRPGQAIAICANNSIDYARMMLAALRAGVVPALIPPSATSEARAAMVADSGAVLAFDDQALRDPPVAEAHGVEYESGPDHPFNIIYSSGTTGTPKGIVQPCSMRWVHMQRGPAYEYDERSVTIVATPLYSNTTLVSFYPALATGGTIVFMEGRFDPANYLGLCERHRVTHSMLVPVQYQRLMAFESFGKYDLSSFVMKLSTSAPFKPELKRQVLERWPGGITEYYGMTEGGATCVLQAHLHPTKLHTVGLPGRGVEIRLIDEEGREVPPGEAGEVCGRSGAMMTGYHNRPGETAKAEWFDGEGRRFIRTGDVGRFDADGFMVLVDRRKDMIISGGFNIYPSDLEAVVSGHPAVREVAVVGVPSEEWGETPVAFVVAQGTASADGIRAWANERLGKTQRLAGVRLVDELPRNAIGKILKRELRDAWMPST